MQFDPYHTWLGIPPEEQPPSHYRLLGIRDFEANGDVIAHAAGRQMTYIRTFKLGRYAKQSQQLLNEIAAAQGCLLSESGKAEYDAELRGRQQAKLRVSERPTAMAPPPVPAPRAVADNLDAASPVMLNAAEEPVRSPPPLPVTGTSPPAPVPISPPPAPSKFVPGAGSYGLAPPEMKPRYAPPAPGEPHRTDPQPKPSPGKPPSLGAPPATSGSSLPLAAVAIVGAVAMLVIGVVLVGGAAVYLLLRSPRVEEFVQAPIDRSDPGDRPDIVPGTPPSTVTDAKGNPSDQTSERDVAAPQPRGATGVESSSTNAASSSSNTTGETTNAGVTIAPGGTKPSDPFTSPSSKSSPSESPSTSGTTTTPDKVTSSTNSTTTETDTASATTGGPSSSTSGDPAPEKFVPPLEAVPDTRAAEPTGTDLQRVTEIRRQLRDEFIELRKAVAKLRSSRGVKHPRQLHDKAKEYLSLGKSASDPIEAYALIQEAYDHALEVDNYGLAKDSLETLIDRFQVDGIKLRLDFLHAFHKKAKQDGENLQVAREAMNWVALAVEQKRFGEARGMCDVAIHCATDANDKEMIRVAREKEAEVDILRKQDEAKVTPTP